MSNPTTPFSWQMPTATDLVTDLPADFEVFGQAVATSMADLLGGTSGQVLAKNSNTDMDFVWVTSDDANAIQNTIVDAKGDLIGATAADTPARLAVGTNGQVLTADSTAATGLAWATASAGSTNMAGKNGVLNSNFSIWQRGTTFNPNTAAYSADRWACTRAVTGSTITRQLTNDTTNLPFIQYCARVQRDSGNSATNSVYLTQSFENVNSTPFIGQTVTMSFYARKGADFSGSLSVYLASGTGTDQNVNGTWTGNTYVINQTPTLTTSWARYSYSGTVAATKTQIAAMFVTGPTGTASTNDYFEVTGVQVEIASSASAYSPNAATFQGELAACQRYYYRTTVFEAYGPIAYGYGSSGTVGKVGMNTTVTMRIKPSAIDYSAVRCDDSSGINITLTSITLGFASGNIMTLLCNATSGFTANRPIVLLSDGSSTSYVGLSSEL
jgi:hypothetical protein